MKLSKSDKFLGKIIKLNNKLYSLTIEKIIWKNFQ
jgi:hypothetical protein